MSVDKETLMRIVRPGDALLYKPKGFFGWAISIKTWHRIAHIEVYIGNGEVVAARYKDGVGQYDLKEKDIYGIYRPNRESSVGNGLIWFYKTAEGQKYDWKAILCFTGLCGSGKKDRMMCSEFATRFYRRSGFDPFPNEDADKVAPFQFAINPFFTLIKVF